MCGITGFCNYYENGEKLIFEMNKKILHRGPDAEGIWFENNKSIFLGHRRLSIVDLTKNGSQPMISKSKRFVIAFNGEIYNYKELAQKLLSDNRNLIFSGRSDTEVLLEMFENYGVKETLKLVRGMYAIALYDREMKKLVLIRDRMGEKPLYYGIINGKFTFASDVTCFECISYFNKEINKKVLGIYFQHGYIPAPYSIYKDVYKLDAGCYLEISEPYTSYEIFNYWSVKEVAKSGEMNLFAGNYSDAVEHLEGLIKKSIARQMVADVPVGAFLSGGIDSSTIVAITQSLSNKKIQTFTIGVVNSDYNEAEDAKKVAEYLGTDHHELYMSERDAMDIIPSLPRIYSEPFADSSQIPTYLVSKIARKNVAVVLSGDGGDELFCGYHSYYKVNDLYEKINKTPYMIRSFAGKILANRIFSNFGKFNIIGKSIQSRSLDQLYILQAESFPLVNKIALEKEMLPCKYSEYDCKYLNETAANLMLIDLLMYHSDDILVKVDRAAMANSLETRIPLLDKEIMEFALSLPMSHKSTGTISESKRILKDVLYKYVPKEIVNRPKKGFSIPIIQWIRSGELRGWAEDLLDKRLIEEQRLLNADIVRLMWSQFIKDGSYSRHIWFLLMFQEWMKQAGYSV